MDKPDDPTHPHDPSVLEHMRDPRAAETVDPHAGVSDDPRVDPTPDRHHSTP